MRPPTRATCYLGSRKGAQGVNPAFVPCSALTRGEERQKCTCCQSLTQVTNRLPRARRGGRQAPRGIRRNPPGQPRRVPLRGASQCLKSMSDQLAYRRVWQKVHAKHRDVCHSHCPLRTSHQVRELPRAPNGSPKNHGGPRTSRYARSSQPRRMSSQVSASVATGVPQVSQPPSKCAGNSVTPNSRSHEQPTAMGRVGPSAVWSSLSIL